MSEVLKVLAFLFPNGWLWLFALSWVAVAMVGSLVSNHQTRRNKILNTAKTFSLATFMISWVMLAGWVATHRFSYTAAIIGYTAALLHSLGDWLAYFANALYRSPGGVKGAFWMRIITSLDRLKVHAVDEARNALHPSELQFMQLEAAEQTKVVVTAPAPLVVTTQPGVSVIKEPPVVPVIDTKDSDVNSPKAQPAT